MPFWKIKKSLESRNLGSWLFTKLFFTIQAIKTNPGSLEKHAFCDIPLGIIRIRKSFIARYAYTYKEFVFMTEATAVQQIDSDRTKKKTDNKKKN